MADTDTAFSLPSLAIPDAPAPVAEGVYALNENHEAEAIGWLIEFFRRGPRNQAKLAAKMEQVQELEQEIWNVYNAYRLSDAVGQQLDVLGELVGEGRGALSDADYRAAIAVRILVNTSDGKLEQLAAIARGISPTAVICPTEASTTVRLELDTLGSVTLTNAYRLLKAAKPAGVRLLLSVGPFSVGSYTGAPVGGLIGTYSDPTSGFRIGAGA